MALETKITCSRTKSGSTGSRGAEILVGSNNKEGDCFRDFREFDSVLSRIKEKATRPAAIPKRKKNVFGDCFPS